MGVEEDLRKTAALATGLQAFHSGDASILMPRESGDFSVDREYVEAMQGYFGQLFSILTEPTVATSLLSTSRVIHSFKNPYISTINNGLLLEHVNDAFRLIYLISEDKPEEYKIKYFKESLRYQPLYNNLANEKWETKVEEKEMEAALELTPDIFIRVPVVISPIITGIKAGLERHIETINGSMSESLSTPERVRKLTKVALNATTLMSRELA